jgi:transposase-like protein/IS1 family transposase
MARIQQMTIPQFEKMFPDEDACSAYLVAHRWPDGVHCPRCESRNVYALRTMAFKWECPDCRMGGAYRFSHIAGTIFENTNKSLREWFRVIHLMLTSKKGISALQVQRVMGFGSYKTAHYMCHRIRAGLMDESFQQLMGIVEVDETFVGGKAKNRHWDKRNIGLGTGGAGKEIVAGAVSRKGNVVARVIQNTRANTLHAFVNEAVSEKVSLLCTDQWGGYRGLDKTYPHKTVDHAKGQYVVGAIHTQTIEGFWSILKRGMVGTFHKVSAKYLPLYVAEFQFRYNNRANADIFGAALGAM